MRLMDHTNQGFMPDEYQNERRLEEMVSRTTEMIRRSRELLNRTLELIHTSNELDGDPQNSPSQDRRQAERRAR